MTKGEKMWKELEALFVKQNDGYSCGAIAIANTLRFFGQKISVARIRKTLRTNKEGTGVHFFEVGIGKYFKDFDVKKSPATLTKLNKELKKGPVMLWYVVPGELQGHVAVVLMEHNGAYVICNVCNDERITLVPKDYLRQCLAVKDINFPVMYRVSKTNK